MNYEILAFNFKCLNIIQIIKKQIILNAFFFYRIIAYLVLFILCISYKSK